MESPEKKLEELLDIVLDGTCADDQQRQFSQLIDAHPELAKPFVGQMRTHSLLQWQCDGVDARSVMAAAEPKLIANATQNRERRTRQTSFPWSSIAAVLIISAGAIAWWFTQDRRDDQLAVAEVIEAAGVTWSENTTAVQPERVLVRGRLAFESGKLTVRFRSGATVVFVGPASMRLESPMLVRLDHGQATAEVPHWAKGFTIETADVEVVDLGTRFGVMARDNGSTDVVIFEGEVDLKPTAGSRRRQKRLHQGEAARVSDKGSIDRIMEVRRERGGAWSTSGHIEPGRSVLKSIRDNIPPSDGSKYYYYQITPTGLEDDVPAYVDRHPHEWNGLTADGLPEFLHRLDYARTFNDYRYINTLEIAVELAEAAELYVFFDDRVPTPKWLRESFADTGVNIGLDEGPWEGIPDHRTAVGAGRSIDNIFSVWRRRCEAGEAVTLGAVGQSSEARAMYGIAAARLESSPSEKQPADSRP